MRWAELEDAHPEFAAELRHRLTSHRHCVLATLRRDGSLRVSGIEAWFWHGDLLLGMMPCSRKAADLDHDGRFALHSAPLDTDLQDPDARLRGQAHRVTNEDEIRAFATSIGHADDESMDLFRAELTGAVLVRVVGDRLVLDSWTPDRGLRQTART
jgi:hypothetical protein